MSSENRDSPRRKVTASAVITSGHARVDGTIMDVSPTGAKVRLGTGVFLGKDCTLASTLFADAVPSRIVWRRGAEIGLRFKSPVQRKDFGNRSGTNAKSFAGGNRLF